MSQKKELAVHLAVVSALLILNGCGFGAEQASPPVDKLKGPAAVLFNIDGAIPQFPNSSSLFKSGAHSQYKLEQLLSKAAGDLMVQEIVIHLGAPDLSFARAGELVQALKNVSARGKPLVCHIDSADNMTYWIAAMACPRILVSPAGGVEALGLSLEAVYVRELLASLGITAEMLHIGKYKDAAESLTRDSMSPEALEASKSLLFELHTIFIDGIAKSRKLDPRRVQELVDKGPYNANESVKLGLVDSEATLFTYLDAVRAKYPGGVIDDYGKKPAKPFSVGDLFKMFTSGAEKPKKEANPRIAIVPVLGPIMSGTEDELFSSMEMVQDMVLVNTLTEISSDDTVKAVVLRIDSPGGSPLASDNIWHALRTLAAKKPVVASLGDVAASGGYWITSAATETLASKSTITGSIGVVGGKIVFQEAASKIGIKTETLTTGKRASLSSPLSPFGEDGRQAITKVMQDTYDMFIDRVATGRKMDRNKVLEVAEGRVWTGSQAIKNGLIDRIGNLQDAVARARELASLPPGTPAEILPEPKGIMEMLGEALGDPQVSVRLAIARRHAGVRRALSIAQLLTKHQVLTVAPFFFEIR